MGVSHTVDRKMTFARCSSVQEGYVILSVFSIQINCYSFLPQVI